MTLTGGLIIIGRSYTAIFNSILPDQTVISEFYPIIGLGGVTCTFSVWAEDIIPTFKEAEGYLFLFYVYLRP